MTRQHAATRRVHQLLAAAGHPLTATAISEITSTTMLRTLTALGVLVREGCADEVVTGDGMRYQIRRDDRPTSGSATINPETTSRRTT